MFGMKLSRGINISRGYTINEDKVLKLNTVISHCVMVNVRNFTWVESMCNNQHRYLQNLLHKYTVWSPTLRIPNINFYRSVSNNLLV